MQETQTRSLGQEDPLKKEMTNHSSILTWAIPWTKEPGRLQSMGLQKSHDLVTKQQQQQIISSPVSSTWQILTHSSSQPYEVGTCIIMPNLQMIKPRHGETEQTAHGWAGSRWQSRLWSHAIWHENPCPTSPRTALSNRKITWAIYVVLNSLVAILNK